MLITNKKFTGKSLIFYKRLKLDIPPEFNMIKIFKIFSIKLFLLRKKAEQLY